MIILGLTQGGCKHTTSEVKGTLTFISVPENPLLISIYCSIPTPGLEYLDHKNILILLWSRELEKEKRNERRERGRRREREREGDTRISGTTAVSSSTTDNRFLSTEWISVRIVVELELGLGGPDTLLLKDNDFCFSFFFRSFPFHSFFFLSFS